MAKTSPEPQDPFNEATPTQAPDAPITTAQLMDLLGKLASAQNQSSENIAQTMATAMMEVRKPYIDPKQEENDRKFRDNNRRQRESERLSMRRNQESCPHIAGCSAQSSSADMYGRTCIVWHQTDATEVVGICTNCQRIFRETDEDFMLWRRKQSINHPMSKSGWDQRYFADPKAAREIARGDRQ